MPTCAALMPVARQITPPMIMAISIPLPASAAVAPNDTNRPVPKIMAAVRSVAVVFPRLRLLEGADLAVVVEAVIALPLPKSALDMQCYSSLTRSRTGGRQRGGRRHDRIRLSLGAAAVRCARDVQG